MAGGYITASCIISKQDVLCNGISVLHKAAGPEEFLETVYRFIGLKYARFYKMDRLSKLAFLAAEILLEDGSGIEGYKPEDIGVILSNSSSSLDTDLKFIETAKDIASPALFVYTLPNIALAEIAIKHQIKGETSFFIFDDFNPVFLEQYINTLLTDNVLEACICGWTEILKEDYTAALFLVEKENNTRKVAAEPVAFSAENLKKLYRHE